MGYFIGNSFKVDVKGVNSVQNFLESDVRGYSHILLTSLRDAFKIRTPGIAQTSLN